MKCQILFSGEKNKKNINLSSAELALRVVKVNAKFSFMHLCHFFCFVRSIIFQRNIFDV